MNLLIDTGNTRIKWALADGPSLVTRGVVEHAEVATLPKVWSGLPRIHRVLVACVAGPNIREAVEDALDRIDGDIDWVVARQQECGVRNGYTEPGKLGADRWAALIGAYALGLVPGVIVSAGTALTVDMMGADGQFAGGIIVPGFRALDAGLRARTALAAETGEFSAFPTSTEDAITTGAIDALCGAVERVARRVAATGSTPRVILTGGDADRIAAHLTVPFTRVDDLVLRGLATIASHKR